MLSSKMTATVLYSAPALGHLADTYKRKINYLMSFDYNVHSSVAEAVFEEIFNARQKIDNIRALENAIGTALSLLTEEQRKVIEAMYLRGWNKDKVAKKLGLPVSLVSSRRSSAFQKLRVYIETLGFTEEKIIEYFDSEKLFIDICARVDETQVRSANFTAKGGKYAKRKTA